MIKKWPTVSDRELLDLRIMKVNAVERTAPKTGKTHEFYYFDSNDWINVVAVTTAGNLVFVKQYRHGNDEITLEVPGGLVDPGEAPIEAASRELAEETGYLSQPLIQIGVVAPNPAIFNNETFTFLALDAEQKVAQQFDGTEDIEVVELPLAEVKRQLMAGQITHSLTINAIYWYELYLAGLS